MKYTAYFLGIITTALLAACDPGKSFIIKAAEKKNVYVIIYADSNLLPGWHSKPEKKIIIRVPASDTSKNLEKGFAYGIGGWSDASISSLAGRIDSVIINNSNEHLLLRSHGSIKEYLQKNLRGKYRNELVIEAK